VCFPSETTAYAKSRFIGGLKRPISSIFSRFMIWSEAGMIRGGAGGSVGGSIGVGGSYSSDSA
jgi:hypothetical protein